MEISNRTPVVSKGEGDGCTEKRNIEQEEKLCKIMEEILISKN